MSLDLGGGFKDNDGTTYNLIISDTWHDTYNYESDNLVIRSPGIKIKWKGNEKIYDPIKPSQAVVTLSATDSANEAAILTPLTSPHTKYYFIVFEGTSTVKWYGYITPVTSSIANESYPTDITIEAVDRLTLLKEDYLYDTSQVTNESEATVSGFALPNRRFGARGPLGYYQYLSGIMTDVVFSLIFDLDYDAKSELIMAEHYSDLRSKISGNQRLAGLFSHIKLQLDGCWYQNYQAIPNYINNMSCYDCLSQLCEVFNARCFQWNGVYYFIQNEIYQHAATVNYSTFEKDATTNNEQPIDKNTGTWTSDGFSYDINPSSKPRWKEGSSFRHKEAFSK